MHSISKHELIELEDISFAVGNNIELIQGAGGNTSIKDDSVIWVKASGFWLSEAKKTNIFLKLNLDISKDLIAKDNEDYSSALMTESLNSNLRPSIETSLHVLMPFRFVIHLHSINVISYAVLNNCSALLAEKLVDINWILIPYARPGLPLAKMLIKLNAFKYEVLILENHGIVICGNSRVEVEQLISLVEDRLFRPTRNKINFKKKLKLKNLLKSSQYKLPKYDISHNLALDDICMKVVRKNPLYPDHIIFLGHGPIKVLSEQEFLNEILNSNTKFFKKIIIIRGIGTVIRKDISKNAELMLYCLTKVLLKTDSATNLKHLLPFEEMELLDWNAEEYRQTIEK
jgi:rhamnose utilization protein RhaD (predicted bifunctional aldolase and dehydrogenase)